MQLPWLIQTFTARTISKPWFKWHFFRTRRSQWEQQGFVGEFRSGTHLLQWYQLKGDNSSIWYKRGAWKKKKKNITVAVFQKLHSAIKGWRHCYHGTKLSQTRNRAASLYTLELRSFAQTLWFQKLHSLCLVWMGGPLNFYWLAKNAAFLVCLRTKCQCSPCKLKRLVP